MSLVLEDGLRQSVFFSMLRKKPITGSPFHMIYDKKYKYKMSDELIEMKRSSINNILFTSIDQNEVIGSYRTPHQETWLQDSLQVFNHPL